MAGCTNKKTLYTRADFRELLTTALTKKFRDKGFVDYIFAEIEKIEDPASRVRYIIEMLKFIAPQMAAMKVEVEQTPTQITQIKFVEVAANKPAELPANVGS